MFSSLSAIVFKKLGFECQIFFGWWGMTEVTSEKVLVATAIIIMI